MLITCAHACFHVVFPASQTLRIRPGKATTTPPATPEELRLRHRRLGLAWDFVRSRHSTRTWLPKSCVDTFRLLSDHVLGSHVAGVKTADCGVPTWSQVLTYELELRKAAYRFVRDGKCTCLNSAIEKVIDSSDLLNLHFIIPISLGKKQSSSSEEEPGIPPPPAPHPAGRGTKGAGKGKQLPSWERQWGKAARTPEGKCICFKYNKRGGCSAGKNCRFEHVCQRCYHRHPFYECRYKRDAKSDKSDARDE